MSAPLQTSITHTTVTVGNSDTAILPANLHRRYLLLQNDSDTLIYVKLDGTAASANNGLRLEANGGTREWTFVVPTGAIRGINGTGNKNLLVIEGR